MLYRENGQFKTSYAADQQIFPIAQDRWAIIGLLLFAFVAVPLLVDEYMFRAILIPFLILSLAALGVNILVGYCGQITLGAGAFMAVGAYAAYNFNVRIEGMPLLVSLLLGGLTAAVVGIFFGIPSLRVRGLYLAVATLAAQFFTDWVFLRITWFTDDSLSGSVSVSNLQVMGWQINNPLSKYLFCLSFWPSWVGVFWAVKISVLRTGHTARPPRCGDFRHLFSFRGAGRLFRANSRFFSSCGSWRHSSAGHRFRFFMGKFSSGADFNRFGPCRIPGGNRLCTGSWRQKLAVGTFSETRPACQHAEKKMIVLGGGSDVIFLIQKGNAPTGASLVWGSHGK
ncbi:hypothetical protein [Candidatus Accumulibacter sp. ACC003]|uniref:branched-chain amino acid ABC transporter permease n=1 Tax=Candidatus Accumulibacter sp. ACC003 TaxID=2823334 RepID=UPI0025B94102|nr:hypothetical protein [Candidatus Accumulibacter sp. ACC003]